MHWITLPLLFLSLIALAMTCFGTLLALRRVSASPPRGDLDPGGAEGVTILKPLKGADPALGRNLESFFCLDYSKYELIFSVADRSDPAHEVVVRLMERYPYVQARILVGVREAGMNPKVNNLLKGYVRARYDLILISDSNVRVQPTYLQRVVAHMEPGVGIVTAVVAGRFAQGWGARLEATYLNAFYARGMGLAAWAGRVCVIGKSMLFRKSAARRFGGLYALKDYLAEDYMAGEAMSQLGLRNVVMVDPIEQVLGRHTLRDFWSRHLRWGRIRRAQAPLVFPLEILASPFVSAITGAFAYSSLTGFAPAQYLAPFLMLWAFCDYLLLRKMNPDEVGVALPLSWFFLEILLIPLRFQVYLGNTVNWRGRELELLPGGLLKTEEESPYGQNEVPGFR